MIEIPEPDTPDKKVMGETGSNCFDVCSSKDAILTPPNEVRGYVESDISCVDSEKQLVSPSK
jgi:hypothetical protein